jgi:hypothetical protein
MGKKTTINYSKSLMERDPNPESSISVGVDGRGSKVILPDLAE